MKIRKGDRIVVRSGKFKGRRGEVVKALPAEGRVIVDGVNLAKRHSKPKRATTQGGIIDKFMPMPAASVAIWCGSHGGPARVGTDMDGQGNKVRVCRKCGAEL